uniref:Uncharacterized protein n=1 Tax=Ascaris lumbricoides TaxID=6252 RepID=A0A0M3IJ49_ASCLU
MRQVSVHQMREASFERYTLERSCAHKLIGVFFFFALRRVYT